MVTPPGDMVAGGPLVVSMSWLGAGGRRMTSSSQSLSGMILGTALTGLFSVVAQSLVTLAATLATPATRGKVVGAIMSGLFPGIPMARTVAGLLANPVGGRTGLWDGSQPRALGAVP